MMKKKQLKYDNLESQLKQTLEQNKKLKQNLNEIPCTCDEVYTSRGLVSPYCPRCQYVDEELLKE